MRLLSRFLFCLLISLSYVNIGAAQDQPKYPNVFGPGPFETTEIEDGLYTFTHSFSRTIFLVTDEGVIVGDPINVDAAKALRDEIAKVTDQPVKYVIYSHEHWDHVLGGQVFKDEGATFISHFNCLDHFYRTPHPDLVIPDITFERNYTLTLGGRTIELLYFGQNHGDCLVVTHIPDEKILFIVDLVTPGSVSGAGGIMRTFYPLEYVRTLREIEALKFKRMIGGHGPPIASRDAVTERREYMEALMIAVRQHLIDGTPYDEISSRVDLPEFAHLKGYDQYLKFNAERMLTFYVGGH